MNSLPMGNYENILDKLNRFIKKHYTKILIRGILMFLILGLLFLFLVLGLEYFLWLNSTGRLVLLLVFVGVALFLLLKYIVTPLFYLFRLKTGMSNKQASLLIGKHFSEVDDRLFNLLDLAEDDNRSELLLASIEQRSKSLVTIPFTQAINFKEAFSYARYLVVPVLLYGIIWISGNLTSFFGSAERVVNFRTAYEPPAPFSFQLLSNDLDVLESEHYTIVVTTHGEIRPETVYIQIDGKRAVLQEDKGSYSYALTPPLKSTEFYFEANGWVSKTYSLNVLSAPTIQDFTVELDYPDYTNKPSETLKSTGNATFPEGTEVTWIVGSRNTDEVKIITQDTVQAFDKESEDIFLFGSTVYHDLNYTISTSNEHVDDHEKLGFNFSIIKDRHPSIKVQQVLDSLNLNLSYYTGQASDDYQLKTIRLVCSVEGNSEAVQQVVLERPKASFSQFYYTFPTGLRLDAGESYSFYFEAIDNDGFRGGKGAKSQVFYTRVLDDNELRNRELEVQQSIIGSMDRSLESFKSQQRELEKINQEQKEKNVLGFKDQDRINDFLQKQERQEDMMRKFSNELKENLSKESKDDKLNQLLRERLERREMEAEKNKKLLQELRKVADKIDKEELAKRLDELGKKQRNGERSLEQLLELTKRYYVLEKSSQLSKELSKQAERQEALSELRVDEKFAEEEQKKLNENFSELAKELDQLRNDNDELKRPLDLEIDEDKKEGVKEDQNAALEEIRRHQGEEQSSTEGRQSSNSDRAKDRQKSAADKMKQMASNLLQSASAAGGSASEAEDAEMLRQILDNLVTFSFKQENLYDNLEEREVDVSSFSSMVKRQQELRGLFEHVDDSLFALSLRQAEISEFVHEQITEVYFNIDKSLENIAEGQMYQGTSHQKYVLNASNSLADFLAKMLANMQQSLQMGKSQGQGQDFQLPDIIKGQGDLKSRVQGMGKDGESKEEQGQNQQGQEKKEGLQPKAGGNEEGQNQSGKEGQESKEGSDGGTSTKADGLSESELNEVYEIYKQQQMLRGQLERQLQDVLNSSDRKLGEKLLKQMDDFAKDLLENGITERTLDKVNSIEHELLKLENAAMKQGKKSERESTSNTKAYNNPVTTRPGMLENYTIETEILNRQALPLRQNFQQKVGEYFKSND